MKITRQEVLPLLIEGFGFKSAGDWTNDGCVTRLKKLDQLVDSTTKIKNKAQDKLLHRLLEAIKAKEKIEVTDGEEEKKGKKGAPAKEVAKKGATKKKAKEEEEEEDDEETEDDGEDDEEGTEDDEEEEEEDEEEEEEVKPAKKDKKSKKEEEEEEEDEEEEEESEDDEEEEEEEKPKKKKGKEKEEKSDGVKRDKFGSKVGSNAAKFNKCISKKGKTMKEITEEAELEGTYYNHMAKLVTEGLVEKTKEGKFRLA